MKDRPLDSLFSRLGLAFVCFFRVVFDARAARSVRDALEDGASPKLMPPRTPAAESAAMRLLSILQREGRLVDFLQQDVTSFSDADVGAAARVVHDGCRKALHAHATIEPVRLEAEGARVTIEAAYDADRLRLLGDVKGSPPYAGVLRHRGWQAVRFAMPETVGVHDETVLAPAEVEVG